MAGNTREIRWSDASDVAQRSLEKLLQFILRTENDYQELLVLWTLHGNIDQDVADQLFEGTATADQLAMTQDLKAALTAAHDIHQTGDLTAIRTMT